MSVFREKTEELERYEFQMGLERGRLALSLDMLTDAGDGHPDHPEVYRGCKGSGGKRNAGDPCEAQGGKRDRAVAKKYRLGHSTFEK
jgi:hypothetical protein